MVQFDQIAKAFKDNFSASMAAAMIMAIMALSGYIVRLHEQVNHIGQARLQAQLDCSHEVLKCEQMWRHKVDSLLRQEMAKTQRQVDELNAILKKVKK